MVDTLDGLRLKTKPVKSKAGKQQVNNKRTRNATELMKFTLLKMDSNAPVISSDPIKVGDSVWLHNSTWDPHAVMGVEIKKPGMLRKVPIIGGAESSISNDKEQVEDVGNIRPVPKQKKNDDGTVRMCPRTFKFTHFCPQIVNREVSALFLRMAVGGLCVFKSKEHQAK